VNQGFEISPETLALIGQRGIKLGVDIFPVDDKTQIAELQRRFRD
jgi:hypothetical protein